MHRMLLRLKILSYCKQGINISRYNDPQYAIDYMNRPTISYAVDWVDV